MVDRDVYDFFDDSDVRGLKRLWAAGGKREIDAFAVEPLGVKISKDVAPALIVFDAKAVTHLACASRVRTAACHPLDFEFEL